MRLVSMNIWNTQGPANRYRVALPRALAECASDVILLQEVGFDGSVLPQSTRLAENVGLRHERYFYAGEWKGHEEGLAILSRYPIVRQYCQRLPEGGDGMRRIICGATIVTDVGDVEVFTTHLAYPIAAHVERRKQVDACLGFMRCISADLAARPLLLAGDLNDVPGSVAVSGFSSLLRDAFAGWDPARRWTFASRNPYTKSELVQDRCLDYVFLNARVELVGAKLVGELPDGAFASDHLGVLVDVRIH